MLFSRLEKMPQTATTHRRSRTTAFAIGLAVVLVIGFLAVSRFGVHLLRRLNAHNPMQLAFLVSFQVDNQAGVDLEIMPIGMLEGTMEYAPLPRYDSQLEGAMPVDWTKPVRLRAGARLTVIYDYDDINFRHILIKDVQGRYYLLDTDRRGTKSHCYGPQKSVYTIPPLPTLPPVPVELIPCFNGSKVIYSGAREYP